MALTFPFTPPDVEIRPEVACVLNLAFGPLSKTARLREGTDSMSVVEAARSMALGGRIAARFPQEQLKEILGSQGAEALRMDRRKNAAAELQAQAVAESLSASVSAMDMPVVFLKGTAMVLEGRILPGSRGLCDVDVLAPTGQEQALQDKLKAEGCFEPPDLPSGEHQLQVLGHPLGLAVEVHLCLRGVRLSGKDSAVFADVNQFGLTRGAEGLPGGARVPVLDLLLAHAVVHGLAQHGLNPKGYPMLRFVADIVDLDLAGAVEGGGWERWVAWVERDVTRREVTALAEMCRRLVGEGDVSDFWCGDDDPALMLRHLVLGVIDSEYRDSLRIRSLAFSLASRGRGSTLLRTFRGAIVLTRGQVEALYGKPKSSLGYWGYRLYRPFDLVGRTLRYGVAAVKGRWR